VLKACALRTTASNSSTAPRALPAFRPATLLLICATVLLVAACGSNDSETTPAEESAALPTSSDASEAAVTSTLDPDSFGEAVMPIVEETCARCHTGNGPGTVHIRLDTAGDIVENSLDIAAIVGAGAMPPWPASDHSVAFADNWSLSPEQIDTIVNWHADGSSIDIDPDTAVVSAHPVIGIESPDMEILPNGSYDGEAGQPDEYRCFVYDPLLTEDAFISSYEFVPDQTEVVHHAIGYLVDHERRERADLRSGEDGQDGWTCFGSSGLGGDETFLGWAPGQAPTMFDEGTGLRVGAGDFIVIQIHYHFEVDAPADQSSLKVNWTQSSVEREIEISQFIAPAEIPCMIGESGPLCDRDNAMVAALAKYGAGGVQADRFNTICGASPEDFADMTEGIATSSCELPVRDFGTLQTVLGHMHEIGASFRMTLNPGSDDELVLLDIPKWDFDWQFNYEPVDDIVLEPGDSIRLDCSWDRALRDADLEASYIFWADGTNDEMCFATVTTA
jgi:hypothetical protein